LLIFFYIKNKALNRKYLPFAAYSASPPRYIKYRSKVIYKNTRIKETKYHRHSCLCSLSGPRTIKQFEANRRNAQHSTGPKTPEGKAAVSMNALRHGLRARTVVLPGENREEFTQLCDDLEVEWEPKSRTEQFYVEQMAVSQWKLIRMEVGEAGVFEDVEGAKNQIPLLDRFWQAECRLERSYARAQRELERLQTSRRQPAQPPEEPTPAPQPAAASEPQPAQNAQSAPASPGLEPTSEIRPPKSEIHLSTPGNFVDGA
jgi:hypothetical protein